MAKEQAPSDQRDLAHEAAAELQELLEVVLDRARAHGDRVLRGVTIRALELSQIVMETTYGEPTECERDLRGILDGPCTFTLEHVDAITQR